MEEREFNLLTEPWIRVMREDCSIEELSLADALLHAHAYKGLAGELPTQNAAVLRLLLAMLHAVFERVDVNGGECEIEDEDDAYDRWQALWMNGSFPEKPLKDYFEQQYENFWLFHPKKPFWQTAKISEEVKTKSEPTKKINGAISESENKVRLFSERNGKEKDNLSNAEAARWLVCLNQYDDNSLKTGLGIAWMGNFSAIIATGKNFFETLMLNFVMLNYEGEVWDIGPASWGKRRNETTNICKTAFPSDPVAILSSHSRYGKLEREGGMITKYKSQRGGSCFDWDSVTRNEQMALWKKDKSDALKVQKLSNKQVWREFSTIIAQKEYISGLVNWHQLLIKGHLIAPDMMLCYEVVSIEYDKSLHSSVENIYADSLQLHAELLSDLGRAYRKYIIDEIEKCDKIAYHIGRLANDLFYAAGGDTKKKASPSNAAKEQYYYEIDVPFRKWLALLRVEEDATEKIREWRKEAESIAWRLAGEMAENAGPAAFVGKMISEGEGKNAKKRYCSSSTAMNWFRYNMKRVWEGKA